MNRGDVVWHKFKEPDKTRPVLILTRNGAISELGSITVVPITGTIRDLQSQVLLAEEDGMNGPCVANVDWIQTVPKAKLGAFITHLSETRLEEIFDAMKFAFGFDS